jgi:Predicted transcriptional regulator
MPASLSTHQKILEILKKNHNSTMDSIANDLGISKMAVLKHLFRMEKEGIIERKSIKKKVGRPVSVFFLTEHGEERFRSSYADTIKSLISFLVDHGHRDLAVQFLKERYALMQTKYAKSLAGLTYEKRLEKLSELRDSAGYMAELKSIPSGCMNLWSLTARFSRLQAFWRRHVAWNPLCLRMSWILIFKQHTVLLKVEVTADS